MDTSEQEPGSDHVAVTVVGMWTITLAGGYVMVKLDPRNDGSGFYSLYTVVGGVMTPLSYANEPLPRPPAWNLPASVVEQCVRDGAARGLLSETAPQAVRIPAWRFVNDFASAVARFDASESRWLGTLTFAGEYGEVEVRGPIVDSALHPDTLPRELVEWGTTVVEDARRRNVVVYLGAAEDLGLGPNSINDLRGRWLVTQPETASNKVLNRALEEGVRITTSSIRMDSVHMTPGGLGGATFDKLSSVQINVGTILSCASSVLGLSNADDPIQFVIGLFKVFSALVPLANKTLEEREATVLWAIWVNRDQRGCVNAANVHQHVHDERKHYDLPLITSGEIDAALQKLETAQCVTRYDSDVGPLVVIRERVTIKYS